MEQQIVEKEPEQSSVLNPDKGFETPVILKDIDERISKAVIQVTDKFKYEIMRCINCPIILECKYPQKRLEKLKLDAKNQAESVYREEIELDNSAENVLRAQGKRDQIYNDIIRNRAVEVLKNERCLYERKEVLTDLQKFVDAGYDITDPRCFMIISELIGDILTSGRMNKAFTNTGMLLKKDTPAGPIYYSNPLLKSKIEFSRLIIEATEILDRILKSDEQVSNEKNFTAHLLKELRMKKEKKDKVDNFKEMSKPVETTIIEDSYEPD